MLWRRCRSLLLLLCSLPKLRVTGVQKLLATSHRIIVAKWR